MRKERQIEIARKQARTVLTVKAYNAIVNAIDRGSEISFRYTDKTGVKENRAKIVPIEFFMTPGYFAGIKRIEAQLNPIDPADVPIEEKIQGTVYLWAIDKADGVRKSFYAETITATWKIPNIVEACLDPSIFHYFWSQILPV